MFPCFQCFAIYILKGNRILEIIYCSLMRCHHYVLRMKYRKFHGSCTGYECYRCEQPPTPLKFKGNLLYLCHRFISNQKPGEWIPKQQAVKDNKILKI